MKYYGLELSSLDTYFQYKEVSSAPGTPQANELRVYAKDKSGVSALYAKDDAGVEHELTNRLGGSGTANQIAFWSGASTLSGNSLFLFDGTHVSLGTATPNYTSLGRAFTVQSTTSAGVELSSTRADADDVLIGSLAAWYATNSVNHNSIASIQFKSSGATANQRGGAILLLTKANGATALTERVRVTPAGFVGMGLSAPGAELHVHSTQGLGTTRGLILSDYVDDAAGPQLRLRKSRGNLTITAPVQASDALGTVFFGGIRDTINTESAAGAAIDATAGSLWSATNSEAFLSLWTVPSGSTSRLERFRVGSAGQWGIGGATFGSLGDIFSSGGASAPPTWVTRATLNAALDHGLLAGLGDDDHSQYALLAGRSGGQTLKGGTGVADILTLQATTGVGAGSESIQGLVGNNGSLTGFVLTQANSQAVMRINGGTNNAPLGIRNTSNSVSAMDLVGDSANANIQVRRYSNDVSGGVFLCIKSRGTVSAPSQSLTGDFPCAFESRGINAAGGVESALATFRSVLTENTTTTGHGSKWEFLVVPNGSTAQAAALTLEQNGNWVMGVATAVIDLSTISAGNPNLKINATSDTPTVTWGAAAGNEASAAPAGYLEILVGANTRYIPFWA